MPHPLTRHGSLAAATVLLTIVLAALLYGRAVGIGYLSDDFLYLDWAREGLGPLMWRVTSGSQPQMIRPLPALQWWLAAAPGGMEAPASGAVATLLHGLQILLHGLVGALVAGVARRLGAGAGKALLLGGLFVAVPIASEPVVWLSASWDVWAALLGLTALGVAIGGPDGTRRAVVAAGLFAVALLSKESVVTLPLVLLALRPIGRCRRTATALFATAAVYLTVRLALFGSLGGYRGAMEAFGPGEVLRFLRNLLVQLPHRLLVVPLKPPVAMPILLAVAHLALVVAFLVAARPWRGARPLVRAVAAFVAAALPVAPILTVGAEHDSARLVYFPLAVLAAALGAVPVARPRAARAVAVTLLVAWCAAATWNTAAWREAAREVRGTLAALATTEARLPPRSQVLVAGHEAWRGAWVWQNSLGHAARWAGLRRDVTWVAGTAAMVRPRGLGRNAFEWRWTPIDGLRDWTACQRVLHRKAPPSHIRLDREAFRYRGPGRLELAIDVPGEFAAVAVVAGRRPFAGRLWWRQEGVPFGLGALRHFRAFGDKPPVVRLDRLPYAGPVVELRLDLHPPATTDDVCALLLLPRPPECVPSTLPRP